MGRRGFTLVEMLLAIAITVVVAAELTMVVTGLFRLQREKMWNVEFAHIMRVAHERVLFGAKSPDGETTYGGLIGASNVVWYGNELVANLAQSTEKTTVGFDPDPYNLTYNVGGRFRLRGMDDGVRELTTGEGGQITNNVVFLTVEATLRDGDGTATNRLERIAVPIPDGIKGDRVDPWDFFLSNPVIERR